MYINFWYPIVLSDELEVGKPYKVKVLGSNLVAWRNEDGTANVLSDTCIHRGGSLGGGWSAGDDRPRVVDGCIVCPYHGWEFSGDGKCVNIPSLGYGSKVPARAKIDSYPVQEKYGIVFAFLGDAPEEERIPIMDVEEYDQEGWRANKVRILDVDYYYERSIENALDPAHNEFIHPTHGFTALNRDTYKVNPYVVEEYKQGHGMWFISLFDAPPLDEDTYGDMRKDSGDLYAGSGTYGPNNVVTHIRPNANMEFRQYFFEAPVDENSTRIFFLNMRNCMIDPEFDDPMMERNLIIAKEDINILVDLHPIQTPLSNTQEMLVPADKAIVEYRDWLAKFDEKGWRIDIEKFHQISGKGVAFAIPSPERRNSKNWVLEAVPTIDSRQARKMAAE